MTVMIPLWSALLGGLLAGALIAWEACRDGYRRGYDDALFWCQHKSYEVQGQMESDYAKVHGKTETVPDYIAGASRVYRWALEQRIARGGP